MQLPKDDSRLPFETPARGRALDKAHQDMAGEPRDEAHRAARHEYLRIFEKTFESLRVAGSDMDDAVRRAHETARPEYDAIFRSTYEKKFHDIFDATFDKLVDKHLNSDAREERNSQ